MWVLNVILIFAAIAVVGWVLWNYGEQLSQGLGVLFSGGHSILVALGVILVEALKAVVVAALVGGVFGLIFFVAGAPDPVPKAVGFSLACVTFGLLMLKALWENLNNLRWAIRHEVRNRYRKR